MNNSQPNSAPVPFDLDAVTRAEAARDHAALTLARKQRTREMREQELAERFGRAAIPSRYRQLDFVSFPVEAIADPIDAERARLVRGTCMRYAETWPAMAKRGTNVVLVGPMGTGKTGLACAIANAVIGTHQGTAMFISAYGAVRHQRDTWRVRGKTETEALADLTTPDLLVLDEVGVQMGSDSEKLMLFEVLNARYAERRPTILLSNLPVESYAVGDDTRQMRPGLRQFLGERVWNRYADDGSFVLACDWPSLRGTSGVSA